MSNAKDTARRQHVSHLTMHSTTHRDVFGDHQLGDQGPPTEATLDQFSVNCPSEGKSY